MTVPVKRKTIHLFRGSPCVRGWSKYQETVERWTLCGIDRSQYRGKHAIKAPQATEDPSLVDCRYCHQLMRSGATSRAPDQAISRTASMPEAGKPASRTAAAAADPPEGSAA